jgi:hypothetical protein
MAIKKCPSLLNFLEQFVVPYLYGHSYFELYHQMPFGELDHGAKGIRAYLCEIFHTNASIYPEDFLRLASLRKRVANKHPCPCGSERRVGRCHNRIVNHTRRKYGRTWLAKEYGETVRLLRSMQ